jgi:hypothetical protein
MSTKVSTLFTVISVTLYGLVQIHVTIYGNQRIFTAKAGRRHCLDYSKETDPLEVEGGFRRIIHSRRGNVVRRDTIDLHA